MGRGVVLRNARSISIGRKLLLDDFTCLDARGSGSLIEIGNNVSVGRASVVTAKECTIRLGDAVNIGTNCRIASLTGIEIGESTLVAAYCYIGPGNHQHGDGNTPLIAAPMEKKGGVKIGAHCWIGTRATILDGVTIGNGAIIGAHSLVRDDVPEGAIVAGTPARVIKQAR
ncbi:MAG: acyltransferase [Bdellovibrionales bacterium]|nr:acyltransferase [Bdellovibrionales bacterium]